MSVKIVKIKDQNVLVNISQQLYKDTQDDSCITCDLIIKSGSKLFEFYAHRLILAGASKFLFDIFSSTEPGKLAVLILPEIEPKILEKILYFIYIGEVRLPPADIEKFIEGCELLKIDSMMEQDLDTEENAKFVESMDKKSNLSSDFDENCLNLYTVAEGETSLKMEISISEEKIHQYDTPPTSDGSDHDENVSNAAKNYISTEEKKYLEKAKTSLINVYRSFRFGEEPNESIDDVIKKTKLIFNEGKLIRAVHNCGFCGSGLRMSYETARYGGSYFRTCNLKKHLRNVHKIEFVKRSRLS